MTLTRSAQWWQLVSQVGLLLPLAAQATPAVIALYLLGLLWRLGLLLGRVSSPPRWLVGTLGLAATLTLALLSDQLGVMSALTNLLLLAYALKSLECKNVSDLTVVVLTGYFLIGLHLLERFSPMVAAHLLLLAALNTVPLLACYRPGSVLSQLGHTSRLLALSLPLALLLFVLVPRLPPIWHMNQPGLARTGLSDSMALGQIAQLTRSDELVMRAAFEHGLPTPPQRYWRALILDQFDGQRWHGSSARISEPPHWPGPSQDYQLLVEATGQPWLAALQYSRSSDPQVQPLDQNRLRWARPLTQRRVITMERPLLSPPPVPLSEAERRRNLALPHHGNPRSRDWAWSLMRRYPEPRDRLQAILTEFRQSPFHYTLKPPALGRDQIDSFLFDTQAGFCGHYASAFVFVARAAQLPARMVTGYQGGEASPDGKLLSVYQYNAHAWAEVWLPGSGWTRYDPTSAVAPERIEQGPTASLGHEPSFLADANSPWLRFGQHSLLWPIKGWWNQVDYQWSRWVMGFDRQQQRQFWQTGWQPLLQGPLLGIMLGLLMLLLWRVRSTLSALTEPAGVARRLYLRGQRLLSPGQLQARDNEPPLEHLQRLQKQQPALAHLFAPVCHSYLRLRYDPDCPPEELAQLKQALQRLRQQVRSDPARYGRPANADGSST
ncbi:transglutaminase family protein [Ferrimonas marina]|uniref:Transglutaminase-like enzyme, putative cysteine protease n=1 Tax=Ferrimonas marina TaxID=299255 RepID=A0A1M5R7F3_9GAMM|nr:DUF3488 and transglutaminase-like domain-containing protein [Ferrimonas marina]SHH22000.1 Transglutaminase-like enzyme, putative cysteine protease [Ferrimonas marina]